VVISKDGDPIGMCETADGCCVSVPGNGTYDVSVSKDGYTSASGTAAVSHCADANVGFALTPLTYKQVCFNMVGCNGLALPDASIAISGGPTLTTDSAGQACYTPEDGDTHTYTVSAEGYANKSGTFKAATCTETTAGQALVPDSDHVCCLAYVFPFPKNLTLSDGQGTYPLTWSATQGGWTTGCVSVPSDNIIACVPGAPAAVQRVSGTVPVIYQMGCQVDPGTGEQRMLMRAFWVSETYRSSTTSKDCQGFQYSGLCSDIGNTNAPGVICGFFGGNPALGPVYQVGANTNSGQTITYSSTMRPVDLTFGGMSSSTDVTCQSGFVYPTPFSTITVTE